MCIAPRLRSAIEVINAVDGANLPNDDYLQDIQGNRIEVWPEHCGLNLTMPYVAEVLARAIYQQMLDNDLMFDGVFFDNVFTTLSWGDSDIYGSQLLVDADPSGLKENF